MDIRELNIKLREDAKKLGLGEAWYKEWGEDTSRQGLIDKFKRGLGFCLAHQWPSNRFIQENFQRELLRDNGILVDDDFDFPFRDRQTRRLVYHTDYVLLGESAATVSFSFGKACKIWVCGNSSVTVNAKYGSSVQIHLLGNTSADVSADFSSGITVISHSPGTSIRKTGVVEVREDYEYPCQPWQGCQGRTDTV